MRITEDIRLFDATKLSAQQSTELIMDGEDGVNGYIFGIVRLFFFN